MRNFSYRLVTFVFFFVSPFCGMISFSLAGRAFIDVVIVIIIIVLHVHSRRLQDPPCSPVFCKVRVSIIASWPITMLEAGNETLLKNNKNIYFARLRPTSNYIAIYSYSINVHVNHSWLT